MLRIIRFILIGILILSCKEEQVLNFSVFSEVYEENARIEINIPVAEGDSPLSNSINNTLQQQMANALSFSEDPVDSFDLDTAIQKFDGEYRDFKSDIEETSLVWEAIFDGEVIYQSEQVVSVALNSYLNTGGAHGNMTISLHNFDGKTGRLLNAEDIISDIDNFTEFVKPYFLAAITEKDDGNFDDYFFGDPFHLPANIGIHEDGILMLYNVYEIGSYAQGITEFTIPFEDVQAFLTIQ